ncbi:MAG: chalcone isomerase family protein [Candidatus Sumerlaeia bacterium]|nr:chalcone isomerase family protein [Candidatus Sumerlaeia bacterium]
MNTLIKLSVLFMLFFSIPAMAEPEGFKVEKGNGEDCSAGACFPKAVILDDVEMKLRKTHLFRYWGFRVYSVALYTKADFRKGDDILDDVPKRLVLHYHRSIDRGKMIEGAEVVMPRNEGDNMDALKERLDKVNAAYVDVSSGDEYAIDYLPGKGLVISLNGEPTVSVEGADFARAYFGIWLGEKPINDGLKRTLLDFDY